MNLKALILGAGAIGLVVVTYTVLSLAFPHKKIGETPDPPDRTQAVEAKNIEPVPAPEPEPPASLASAETVPPDSASEPGDSSSTTDRRDRTWWPTKSTPEQLNLLYARQATDGRAVLVLFDTYFPSLEAVSSKLKLTTTAGKPVEGQWEFGGSRRMLLFKDLPPGRYIVAVEGDLANVNGQTLGKRLKGPVTIR